MPIMESMDTYKIIMTLIAIFSVGFNVYQFRIKKSKLKFRMVYGTEINLDEVGTFLCARIFVSNIGGETAIYNGLEAKDAKGNLFYPSCTIKTGLKIEPNSSLAGVVPNGHLLSSGTSELYVVDGVFKKHKIPNKVLSTCLQELKQEVDRWESYGHSVHPTSLLKKA